MAKEDFEKLVADVVPVLREKAVKHGALLAIVNKFLNAYQMTGGEQVKAFFDEIKLPLSKAEQAAMKARNRPAHGESGSDTSVAELVRHGHAYRMLFERTFLRLLDYDGHYVDRTTLGHPSRLLNDVPSDSVT